MDLTAQTNKIAAQSELVKKIREEVGKVIVGQERLIDRLILALVTDGHILLEGVPGLAKTLMVAGVSDIGAPVNWTYATPFSTRVTVAV